MTKYHWQQRYAFDRFDLEGPMSRLVGWIVGTPDKYSSIEREANFLGYATAYIVRPQYGQKINWTWKIWWVDRDEKGFYKPDSSTDGVTYSEMDDAKVALQEKFRINADDVTTVKWRGNLTEYN